MSKARTLFHNVRLLDPASGLDQLGALLVEGETIAALSVGADLASIEDARVVDGKGACLAPGLVDMRVTFGEPGAEHKETFASGGMAAVAGGVTSLACLPDSDPPIDDAAMVEFVARRARLVKKAKVYPYGAITKNLDGRQLTEMGLLRDAGAVGFTDGNRAVANSLVMRRALAYSRFVGAPVLHHCEDSDLAQGDMNEGEVATRLGLAGIPVAAEVIMIERDLRLVELTGGHLHISHISTAAGIDAVRQAKQRGLPVSADTAPHYFALNELAVEGYRTFAKVRPPLRSEADRQAVIQGLVDGTIDAIASDHCPQDQDSKRLPFGMAEDGVVGLETLLPISLELVRHSHLSLLQLLAKLTAAPAHLLDLAGGRLHEGEAADLVLFDPDKPYKVTEEALHSLSRNTAFEGHLTQGAVLETLVDGRVVYRRAGQA